MASVAFMVATSLILLLPDYPVLARAPPRHFAVKIHRAAGGIASLCSGADYPDLCVSAARGLHGPTSKEALVKASVQAAIKKVKRAKVIASSIARSVHQDQRSKNQIQDCREVYDSALENLQSSIKALKSESFADFEHLLSSAMTDMDTCDEGYTEAGKKSPLAGPDEETNKFASNALALAEANMGSD